MLQQGMNWKCGVQHFVAVDDNIDLKTRVMIAMRITIQVRQIKKVHLCQQKITLDLYFWVVNYDLFFNNFSSALK